MTAPKATSAIAICLLIALSGCAFVQSAVDSALGRGTTELREARALARSEREAGLSDAQIQRRLTFLTDRLDERRLHAAAWEYGWVAIVGGGGIAAATQAALADAGSTHQINDIAQAGKACIGVTYLLLNPMPNIDGADPVREMPSATREERLAQLADAEERLARTAERAHNRTSWWLHIGTVFINAAAAAPALAYGNGGLAASSFGIGVAAGEAQAWSQPWNGPDDWKEYENFVDTDGNPMPYVPEARWRLVPQGGGVAVQARF